jgi:hypothetical protein
MVDLPSGDLPPADEGVRAHLRNRVSRLLRDPTAGECVITVATHEGRVSVTLRERPEVAGDVEGR